MIRDIRYRLFGVPAIAILIYFTFVVINSSHPFNELLYWSRYHTYEFSMVLLNSFLVWQGGYMLIGLVDKRYPWQKSLGKRLRVQSLIISAWTLLVLGASARLFDAWLIHGHFQVLQPQQYIIMGMLVSLQVCTILSGIYLFRQWRRTMLVSEALKRENLKSQLDLLKNQVSPHFLFNCFNTLVAIIPEDPLMANEFVQKLADVYRYNLQHKDKTTIELRTELDCIRAYIFLLKIRFGEGFNVDIDVPEEQLYQQVAPFSLQMLIENAVKHNVISANRPLSVDVFLEENKSQLVVRNNLQRKERPGSSIGIGLSNIRTRYKVIAEETIEILEDPSYFTVRLPLLK